MALSDVCLRACVVVSKDFSAPADSPILYVVSVNDANIGDLVSKLQK